MDFGEHDCELGAGEEVIEEPELEEEGVVAGDDRGGTVAGVERDVASVAGCGGNEGLPADLTFGF